MNVIRLFGLNYTNHLTTWTSSPGSGLREWIDTIQNLPARPTLLAYDADASERYPENNIERVEALFAAFDRGDWVGDRDEAIEAYNKWASHDAYPLYTKYKGMTVKYVGGTRQIGPRKPVPALPVEVHNKAKFDAEAAWKAIQDLSKGS